MANVKIIKEVINGPARSWRLCFQWCEYIYDDGSSEYGYRFIWRRPNNHLQAARGQARIPTFNDMQILLNMAQQEGWLGTIENTI